jgi:hypothetical protein
MSVEGGFSDWHASSMDAIHAKVSKKVGVVIKGKL